MELEISEIYNYNLTCVLTVDGYVPLTFRTAYKSRNTRGGFVFLRGENGRSIFNMKINPDYGSIVGFTLVSFDKCHRCHAPVALPAVEGLPSLHLSSEEIGHLGEMHGLDMSSEFTVGFGESVIEIDLGELAVADSRIAFDRVSFFARESKIVGITVDGFTSEQIDLMRSQQLFPSQC